VNDKKAITAVLGSAEAMQAEIKGLKDELAEFVQVSFRQIAHQQADGWWDTMALSTAVSLGDKLVELGTWKRQPKGGGRRWFYRPIVPDPVQAVKEAT
jgi:hypothetical protein